MQTSSEICAVLLSTIQTFMRKRKLANYLNEETLPNNLDMIGNHVLITFIVDNFHILKMSDLGLTPVGETYKYARVLVSGYEISLYIDPYMRYDNQDMTLICGEFKEKYEFNNIIPF
jgi:hypothetical protein